MKRIFTLLFLFPVVGFSQIALIDVHLKKPIEYVTNVPPDITNKGVVPIYKNELDSVIVILNNMKGIFVRHKRSDAEYFHYATEHSIFNIRRYRYPENDLYSVILTSKDDPLGSGMVISNKRDDYKKTLDFIDRFIDYIKKYR